jgi:hypothetical protein
LQQIHIQGKLSINFIIEFKGSTMKTYIHFFFIFLIFASFFGCDGDPGSCSQELSTNYDGTDYHFSQCIDYTGNKWNPINAQNDCKDRIIEGTYNEKKCPDENSLGQCIYKKDQWGEITVTYYKEDGLTVDIVKNVCNQVGEWKE